MANTGTNDTETAIDESATERVLHIRFQRSGEQRIEATLKALDRGETPKPYFECVFQEIEDLHTVTRPTNLTLLRTLATEEPESIRETARLVSRDVRQVHRNLEELEALGVIDFEETGQTKRPIVWYDTIEVDLPLTENDTGTPVEA